MDFMGPFPSFYGNKYILLAVVYVLKWVEAIASLTNDAHMVTKFFKKHIFPRFGTPRVLISAGGQHFLEKRFEGVLKKYGVYQRLVLAIIRKVVAKLKSATERSRAFWRRRLQGQEEIRRISWMTLFGPTDKHSKPLLEPHHTTLNYDLLRASEKRLFDINELDEIRLDAYESSRLYKEKTKRWHDKALMRRSFEVGQLVLLFNTRLKLFPGKLKSHWTGPFKITRVFSYGSTELSNAKGETFKVNGQGNSSTKTSYGTKEAKEERKDSITTKNEDQRDKFQISKIGL
ncbi:uncharacterized protein LOC130826509 [Amaranthus tricolor]|uniref:uncharacterized protein LOC130826509 n=1 Tax=Amaranthus tricolor TaxID=29722 RepID=UPI0025831ACE|nr:uncharacterized protein LOC130826509 [Amaranthus tricolor]